MSKNFNRPVLKGTTVVATDDGWLALTGGRDGHELLFDIPNLHTRLEAANLLNDDDRRYRIRAESGFETSTVETVKETQPTVEVEPELTPLENLETYDEELLNKYGKQELMNFVKENKLGNPRSGKDAIKILLELL